MMVRGSRATGGMMTAMGDTTTARGSRATGGTMTATGGTRTRHINDNRRHNNGKGQQGAGNG
jgi:hypothetical protein